MKKVHFIGIGGIGMSALAQYYNDQGVIVTGSDRDPSQKVHDVLATKGIVVVVGHSASNVPSDADLVVYSDAVPEDNPERARARELGIPELCYFKMLGQVSLGKRTIAVAGTKGKTTTTGMLARILRDAGVSPTAIVGSIVRDFDSNYLHGDSDIFVVEACEYRDHLLELSPQILVVTNLEWDHTDWFPSFQVMQATFRRAIERVPADGYIVTNSNNPNIAPLLAGAKAQVIDYTQEPAYDLRIATNFNRENARAAAAAARVILPSISNETIASALSDFHDAWRRFEFKGKSAGGADVYDDYAHNPMSVRAASKALREKTKGKVFIAFHPHLYSRTRDLLDEFSTAFSAADKVFIAPIYPAREVDDGSISSEILAERIRAAGTDATALDFDAIEKALKEATHDDVIMTMGAGDIYKVADALVK